METILGAGGVGDTVGVSTSGRQSTMAAEQATCRPEHHWSWQQSLSQREDEEQP